MIEGYRNRGTNKKIIPATAQEKGLICKKDTVTVFVPAA